MTTVTARAYSLCGSADLLAAVFREDVEATRVRLGLPPKRPSHTLLTCRSCGEQRARGAGKKGQKLCVKCRAGVPVACEECETVVLRKRHDVFTAARRGAVHQFCGKHCQGVWLARTV